MIKIRVHIENDEDNTDQDVFIDILLPSIPQKGEILYLSQKSLEYLNGLAQKSVEVAQKYCPKYFYGASIQIEDVEEKNLCDLKFSDCIYVREVFFTENSEIVQISIDSEKD